MTSTPAKPAASQTKVLPQAKPQAPAQASMGRPAPAQPVRQASARFSQSQIAPPRRVIRMPSESLNEDRLSDFQESEASLIAKSI